jgi:hypothetical protein
MARPKRPKPLYAGADLAEKYATAAYGPDGASEAFRSAAAWLEQADMLRPADAHRLIEEARKAYAKGDVAFFDGLALVARQRHSPVEDFVRFYIVSTCLGLWGQKREVTLRQLSDELTERGCKVDDRHLRRICRQLGVSLKPDRVGRRRKSPKTGPRNSLYLP